MKLQIVTRTSAHTIRRAATSWAKTASPRNRFGAGAQDPGLDAVYGGDELGPDDDKPIYDTREQAKAAVQRLNRAWEDPSIWPEDEPKPHFFIEPVKIVFTEGKSEVVPC